MRLLLPPCEQRVPVTAAAAAPPGNRTGKEVLPVMFGGRKLATRGSSNIPWQPVFSFWLLRCYRAFLFSFFPPRVCTALFLVSQGPVHPLMLPDARNAAIVPAIQSQYKLSQQHVAAKSILLHSVHFFVSLSLFYLSVSPLILVPLFHSCVPSFFPLRGCCKAPARVFVCAYIYMHLVRFLSTYVFSPSLSLLFFYF